MPFASVEELFGSESPFQTKRENNWPLVLYGGCSDESDAKPGFAIAGYSAAIDTWRRLECQWQELLKRWNLKYFKASECENGLAEFAQYRDDSTNLKSPLKPHERERLRKAKIDFVDAICKHHHVLQGYGAAIITEDFEGVIDEDPGAPSLFLDKPYSIGAQLCLIAAAMLVRDLNTRRSSHDQIEIRPILGSYEERGGIAKAVFDNFAKKNPRSAEVILPPQFDEDRTNSCLQVADTLAYEICKQLTRKPKTPDDDYMRVPLRSLLPAMHRVFRLDRKNLTDIMRNHTPDSISILHLLPEELS